MNMVTSVDGTAIAYERTGEGSPLVLIHGSTADHSRWQPILPALEQDFTVYAVDPPGRGGSGDAESYALEREFEDVAAVVDSIGEPVNLLGHSYGALCSLGAAPLTRNLRTLALYEPPIAVRGHAILSAETLSQLQALVADGENEEALIFFFREVARMAPKQIEVLRMAPNWPARVEAAARTIVREAEAPPAYDFIPERFAAVTTPTLLLLGSESPQFMADATVAVSEALPNSRIVTLEGQEHVAMNTAPDLFVRTVVEFLRA